MAEAFGTATNEKIRVVKPTQYETVPTPAQDGKGLYAAESGFDSAHVHGATVAGVRSISEPAPAADSSGILNAIEAVYRVAAARRAWLLSELKALDAALAPFARAANGNPPASGPPDDGALVQALLQFREQHGGDVK